MTMPRIVSEERILFLRIARKAILKSAGIVENSLEI